MCHAILWTITEHAMGSEKSTEWFVVLVADLGPIHRLGFGGGLHKDIVTGILVWLY